MISILAFFIISNPVNESVQPYIGYHFSTSRSRTDLSADNSVRKSREKIYKIGFPFEHSQLDKYGFPETNLILLPEINVGTRLLGFTLAAGPETEIFMGPRSDPMYLVLGAQAGVLYFYIFNQGNFGAGVVDGQETRYSGVDRNTIATVLNAYFGVKFTFANSWAGKVLIDTQLSAGHLAKNTIQSPFSSSIGWTSGVNLQIEF